MPPAGVGGRSRNAWNPSRERKVVRLYTLTKLDKEEIRKVLQAGDFNPSLTDIQKKLRTLFPPDYAKSYRSFRPLNGDNMKLRFDHLRRCKHGRISKDKRRQSRVRSRVRSRDSFYRRMLDSQFEMLDGYAHAFRNYSDTAFEKPPIVISSDLLDSQPVRSTMLLLDGSSISYRPDPESGNIMHPYPHALIQDHLSLTDTGISNNPSCSSLEQSLRVSRNQQTLKMQTAKLRDLGKRLAAKYSDSYLTHIHSVLRYSSSNSWRSSLTSFSSGASSFRSKSTDHDILMTGGTNAASSSLLTSNLPHVVNEEAKSAMAGNEHKIRPEFKARGKIPATSFSPLRPFNSKAEREARLTVSEQEIWDDLVDENALAPPSPRPQYLHLSPLRRDCCKKLPHDPNQKRRKNDICRLCGFSTEHRAAIKFGWMEDYHDPDVLNIIDFYGNSPLHCAAASVATYELPKISFMVDQGLDIHVCNTSGETFLHLLCQKVFTSPTAQDSFLSLLHKLSKKKFRFSCRDYHGRTALHNLLQRASCQPESHVAKYETRFLFGVFDLIKPILDAWDNAGVSLLTLLENMANSEPDQRYNSRLEDLTAPYRSFSYFPNQSLEHMYPHKFTDSTFIMLVDTRRENPEGAMWIDSAGDSPLIALLKTWKKSTDDAEEPALEYQVKRMITLGTSVHTRDREGNTALAIAAQRGLRPIVNLLLSYGANIHSRDYYGRGILKQMEESMALATGKAGDAKLWTRILSCHIALADAGAKVSPSRQEEWMLPFGLYIFKEMPLGKEASPEPPIHRARKRRRSYEFGDDSEGVEGG